MLMDKSGLLRAVLAIVGVLLLSLLLAVFVVEDIRASVEARVESCERICEPQPAFYMDGFLGLGHTCRCGNR